MKATLKCLIAVALCLTIFAPHFVLGIITAAYQLPITLKAVIYCATLALTLNAPRLYRLAKRVKGESKRKGANQHMYHGIPVDEMASYLLQSGSFTTEAMNRLALPQRKWAKIADELEHHGILRRGENNARVLTEITREELVRQLRDGFPLTYDGVSKTWVEKRGSFDQWVLARERKEAKEQEQHERLERKEDRMRKNIKRMQEEQSTFANIMSLAQ